ncbi:MAG TPA: hypothetical protein VGN54_11595 [Mycobacteriales bacterium]|jgi:hypothetical protein|nr:hypothetical protein [Mycobacteriales bacterium]
MTDQWAQPLTPDGPPTGEQTSWRRRHRRVIAIGSVAVVAVLIALGAVGLSDRAAGPSAITAAEATTPQKAADGYYQALAARSAQRAFALLCSVRQAAGYSGYSSSVSRNVNSGTGIKSWKRTGAPQIAGDQASVQGRLVLDDGDSTLITLVLLQEGGKWRICTSNLGGILPGPGPGGGGSTSNA